MADTLIQQNIQNIIDQMGGSNFKSPMTKDEPGQSFSNLMNTLNANTQAVQSNFTNKAAKIDAPIKANKVNSTNNQIKIQSIDKNQKVTINNSVKLASNENTSTVVENTNNLTTTIVKDNSSIAVDTAVNETLDTNSGQKLPSPVLNLQVSKDINTDDTELLSDDDKEMLLQILNDILLTYGVDLSQDETLNTFIQDSFESIQTLEDVVKVVDDLTRLLDDFNIEPQQKENIKKVFEKFNNIIAQKTDELSILDEISDSSIAVIDELITKINSKINADKKDSQNKNDEQFELKTDIKQSEKVEIAVKENVFDKIPELKQTIDALKDIISSDNIKSDVINSDIKDIINITANISDKLTNVVDKVSSGIEKINEFLKVETNDITNVIDLGKNLVDDIKELISNLSQDDNKIAIVKDVVTKIVDKLPLVQTLTSDTIDVSLDYNEDIKNLNDLKNDIVEVSTKIQLDENLAVESDNSKLKEILEVFEKFENSDTYKNFDKADLEKINELVANIKTAIDLTSKSENQNNEIIAETKQVENLSVKVENIVSEIETYLSATTNQDTKVQFDKNSTNIVQQQEINLDDESIKLVDIDSKNSGFENNKDDKNTLNIKNVTKNTVEPKVSNEQKTDNKLSENIDADQVEIEYSDIVQSKILLSATDEVAKLAMEAEESNIEVQNTNPVSQIVQQDRQFDNQLSKTLFQPKMMNNNNDLSKFDIFDQITNKLTELNNNQGHKLTMVLRPNDLGRLSIQLTTGRLGLTTSIVAQNEQVRAYIEKNIHSLRSQLVEAGVNVNNIEIKTQGSSDSTNYDGNKAFEEQNKENSNNPNQKNKQNQKQKEQTLLSMSDYDTHFKKDFSNVLSKTLSYTLN